MKTTEEKVLRLTRKSVSIDVEKGIQSTNIRVGIVFGKHCLHLGNNQVIKSVAKPMNFV